MTDDFDDSVENLGKRQNLCGIESPYPLQYEYADLYDDDSR